MYNFIVGIIFIISFGIIETNFMFDYCKDFSVTMKTLTMICNTAMFYCIGNFLGEFINHIEDSKNN